MRPAFKTQREERVKRDPVEYRKKLNARVNAIQDPSQALRASMDTIFEVFCK